MTVLAGTNIITPAGPVDHGWIEIDGERIAGVGRGEPPHPFTGSRLAGWIVPGFVDIHVHGGGGHDACAGPDAAVLSALFHRRHGTTASLVSLMSAPVRTLCTQLGWIADLCDDGRAGIVGAHLEGPFLSPSRCGAHDPAHLAPPDRAVLARLLDAVRGHLSVVTIAPELPGALGVIDDLVAAGVVAAVGHTDATYDVAREAFERGASLATHLHNGMRAVHHREPGAVLAALDSHALCEVINDGVHVHPAVVREVLARGPARLILITDAMSAAGVGDGQYTLGGRNVVVNSGCARLAETAQLAGSTLTMAQALRRTVEQGVPIQVATAAAATNPASALGRHDDIGSIETGRYADLVVLDQDLRVDAVMVHGLWTDLAPG
ncbi:MAG TPA: N-acetylglucosamine-6-phosphate deacetylase [Mycobacterium sp.]|nr:N-acetylglucosamine-6-phosphate deacetylase [Mycobacterium sp.]